MNSLLEQVKKRRTNLGLKQNDMLLRMGMSRQQYQRLEARGNPRLDTLELVAKGLKAELMLIPQEKLGAVRAVLASDGDEGFNKAAQPREGGALSDDPWKGLLEGDDG